MIVYLAQAIQAFVMYCVNGTSRSSLLIESTDSMITIGWLFQITKLVNRVLVVHRVLNARVKRMRDCEFLPHAQSFYEH